MIVSAWGFSARIAGTGVTIRQLTAAVLGRMSREESPAVTFQPVGPTDGLVGLAARILPGTLAVRILEDGRPLAGEAVRFEVAQGSGTLVRSFDLSRTTDVAGTAGVRFLCPSRAGFATVRAARDAFDPVTGEPIEQVLAEWRIRTVFRENAWPGTFTARMGDVRGLPYAGQDVEYRIADGAALPPAGDRGILLPGVAMMDGEGRTHAAYVAGEETLEGTLYIYYWLLDLGPWLETSGESGQPGPYGRPPPEEDAPPSEGLPPEEPPPEEGAPR